MSIRVFILLLASSGMVHVQSLVENKAVRTGMISWAFSNEDLALFLNGLIPPGENLSERGNG